MNVTIRPAQETDLDAIVRLGADMHAESTYADMDYDGDQFFFFLSHLLDMPNSEVFVADAYGDVQGMLACSAVKSFFGKDLGAVEYLWYVTPDFRQTGLGCDLLTAYVDWAKAQGVKRIQAGNSAGMPDDVYVKLLSSVGLQRAGSLMYRTL